jgi:hypothetical protein
MAARFTKGDSVQSTRQISPQKRVAREPPAKSHVLSRGNTMSGMPGYIDAHQSENMGGARGGKGFGPHREAPVGRHGGHNSVDHPREPTGTMVKDYKRSSTGRPGPYKMNTNDGGKHVHTGLHHSVHKQAGQKAPPTAHGIIAPGHRGRMERLVGRAKTSWEK